MQESLYWHDYETFGINPASDRPAQFAGVRTDLDLNIIGDPLVIYCKIADDYLPSPEACLVTGITPQHANQHGVNEAEFIAQIHAELAQRNTCTVGYNNIRFDDEFTRYTLYRNFFDPYAREWKNGNSRWDLLDAVRLTRALRPDGIHWPINEDGSISNKLEHITAANGLMHEAAHDALSDVHATIAVAKLIRDAQPRLYNYLFDNRGKQPTSELLNLRERNMLVHTSGMFANDVLNTSLVMPLTKHPVNGNGIIVYDLRHDPAPLLELNAEDIHQCVFTAAADLPEGLARIPLKTIHINKCPVVANRKTLDADSAARIDIDPDVCAQRRERILSAIDSVSEKVSQAFSLQQFDPVYDPDLNLYSGGFFSSDDRRKMDELRQATPEQLAGIAPVFDDSRIPEMLFRYRARNFPDSLNTQEKADWEHFRQEKLFAGEHSRYEQFNQSLAHCRAEYPDKLELLNWIADYATSITPTS